MTTKTYSYEAINSSGELVKGMVEAESADAASTNLNHQHLIPLDVSEPGSGLHKQINLPGRRSRTTPKDLAIFMRQFASMTAAGLTLIRALSILEEQTPKPKLRSAIANVKADVQGGMTVSAAMSSHPDHFPLMAVNMIKAAESGGFLDDALKRIAGIYESEANLRSKIKSAMTYPVMVLLFSLLMGSAVIIFIVPIFAKMFHNLGGKLPLPTQIMVNLSHSMWWMGPLIVAGFLVTARVLRKAIQTQPSVRLAVDRVKLRAPVFGSLFTKLAISRWARNLASLLGVGVPILQALEIVGDTSGNAVITEAMKDVRAGVRSGQQISTPLSKNPLFPQMVVQMLEVGEETGQITEMLDKVADFYDHEVETATESLTSTMEPLLVVLLGAVIGAMVICLYLPMFSIYKHIQQ
jgi:type IV pilus assembly protein PilC